MPNGNILINYFDLAKSIYFGKIYSQDGYLIVDEFDVLNDGYSIY